MWLLVAVAAYWVYVALRSAREPGDGGLARALLLATGSLLLAAWVGVREIQARARNQAAAGARAARMLLMAQLGQQDDATLERIASAGGSAGEVALLILRGRHLGNPAGSPRSPRPES